MMTGFDWLFFFEVVLGGLLSGVMYALVALGFVLIFKASGVLNFAQGAMVLFAALTFVFLLDYGEGGVIWTWTGWLSLGLAIVAGVFYFAPRSPLVGKYPRTAQWALVAIILITLVVLTAVFGQDSDMWRALFICLLAFFVLVLGVGDARSGSLVLFGLALASLIPLGAMLGVGETWNFWRALAVTLLVMVLLALAIERWALRPLVNQAPIILFMVTIGLNFLIEGVAQGVWDSNVHAIDIGIPDFPIEWVDEHVGIFISRFDVFAAVTAGALVAALALFFQRTRVGRALRAVADDHQAALSVGIPLKNIWAIVWSAAGFVALVAGMLWGSKLGVQFSLSLIVLKALPVLILGGFTSIPGAIVGGLIIGVSEKVVEVYIGIPYFGGGTESWMPYILALLFLLVRPQGLFGERIIERV